MSTVATAPDETIDAEAVRPALVSVIEQLALAGVNLADPDDAGQVRAIAGTLRDVAPVLGMDRAEFEAEYGRALLIAIGPEVEDAEAGRLHPDGADDLPVPSAPPALQTEAQEAVKLAARWNAAEPVNLTGDVFLSGWLHRAWGGLNVDLAGSTEMVERAERLAAAGTDGARTVEAFVRDAHEVANWIDVQHKRGGSRSEHVDPELLELYADVTNAHSAALAKLGVEDAAGCRKARAGAPGPVSDLCAAAPGISGTLVRYARAAYSNARGHKTKAGTPERLEADRKRLAEQMLALVKALEKHNLSMPAGLAGEVRAFALAAGAEAAPVDAIEQAERSLAERFPRANYTGEEIGRFDPNTVYLQVRDLAAGRLLGYAWATLTEAGDTVDMRVANEQLREYADYAFPGWGNGASRTGVTDENGRLAYRVSPNGKTVTFIPETVEFSDFDPVERVDHVTVEQAQQPEAPEDGGQAGGGDGASGSEGAALEAAPDAAASPAGSAPRQLTLSFEPARPNGLPAGQVSLAYLARAEHFDVRLSAGDAAGGLDRLDLRDYVVAFAPTGPGATGTLYLAPSDGVREAFGVVADADAAAVVEAFHGDDGRGGADHLLALPLPPADEPAHAVGYADRLYYRSDKAIRPADAVKVRAWVHDFTPETARVYRWPFRDHRRPAYLVSNVEVTAAGIH